MKKEIQPTTLLATKLHRPPLPADHVRRADLLRVLMGEDSHPTVLVSAPAGYGKSTLVASWLDECERPWGWFSLDETDNDPRNFLSYFVAAVKSAIPGAMTETQALLEAPSLPPVPLVATTLINELERVESCLALVLDDIHLLKDKSVHEFLNLLLRHRSESLQLVLVGRRDPVLPIAGLRAKGLLTEIRMRDLRFSGDEAAAFLLATSDHPWDISISQDLAQKTEGWVTGLRLATLALRGEEDPGLKLLELKGTTRFVVDYLVSEVLENQPAEIRGLMLATSILERFCAPLCDALEGLSPLEGGKIGEGHGFIEWLQVNNLFVIPLDTENRWFRYHHLFGDLLRGQLKRVASVQEINALHSRASAWCEENGHIEEAIRLALAAGAVDAAADLVERHRDAEYDADRWFVVDRWLGLLPQMIKQKRLRLLLTEARVLNDRFRLEDIPAVINQAQALLEKTQATDLDRGELYYFQGFILFWMGDGAQAQAILEKALALVPEDHTGYIRGQIELFVALACSISGRQEEALTRLQGWIQKQGLRTGFRWERLQYGLAVICYINGDLPEAYRESRVFLDDGRRTGKAFILAWADYLLGLIAFHRHEVTGVVRHFGRVTEHRFAANTRATVDAFAGLAIAAELDGRPDDVGPLLENARDHARWAGDSMLHEVVRACEARIALLRGDMEAADRWQRGFSLPLQVPGMIFFLVNPCITECRVLVARGTKADLDEAEVKLGQLRKQLEDLHFTCHLIDIMVLQAMMADRRKKMTQALDLLQETLELAAPRGWLSPFIQQGLPLAELLRELKKTGRATDLVDSVLAGFSEPGLGANRVLPAAESLVEPLSNRELDVLELLAKRLQTKEIAHELAISPLTVKSHLRTIYQKLDVSNRRQAVEKAVRLRIIL